jgi:GxxExxY protein
MALTDSGHSQIFSQGDREIGSSARFFGFTQRSATYGATQSLGDRLADMQDLDLSEQVIAACIEVHNQLGPGLLESIYEESLCEELSIRNLRFERQRALPIEYKGRLLEQHYRVDLIVESRLLVEVKAVDALLPVHAAQVVTYLRLSRLESGLLVNFNGLSIRHGLRRLSRTPKSSRSPDLPVKKSRPS